MTSPVTAYITEQQFLNYTKSKADIGNTQITEAIEASCRKIDDHCGRSFYSYTDTQYFHTDSCSPVGAWILELPESEIASTSSLVVSTDANGDGTYATTWTMNTDFMLEPVNTTRAGVSGWPWTRLRAVGTKTFPLSYRITARPEVRIAGTFGWAAVPDAVVQATKILASMHYKMGETPLGTAGFGEYGEIRVKEIPQVAALVAPYRRGNSFGVA